MLTGVTGFAGRFLADYLLDRGYQVIGASRKPPENPKIEFFQISNLDKETNWRPALEKADYVIHLAARVHQMNEAPGNEHLYFENNVDATLNLATQSAAAGIKKFIFVSSIKAVTGGDTETAINEATHCQPFDIYGCTKLKAEQELEKLSKRVDLPIVILRPPLMYGPGVKGNMASLIKIAKRVPALPLAGINNRRNFLGITNFSSAIEAIINSEKVPQNVYLISDGETISTSELIKRIAKVFNPACRVFPLPGIVWSILRRTPFVKKRLSKLTDSLEMDSSAFCKDLDWTPPLSMIEELMKIKENSK